MSPPALALVHGWSFDARFWDGMLACLPGWTAWRLDPLAVPLAGFPPDPVSPWLAVGHSLGGLALLRAWGAAAPPGLVGVMLINGFTRLLADAPHSAGVDPRKLETMRWGVRRDASRQVARFQQQAGWEMPGLTTSLVSAQLEAGLALMATGDVREIWGRLTLPRRVLAARDDAIVAAAWTEALFDAPHVVWCEDGGHCLPCTRPRWCARQLQDFAGDCP
ncbi:MAG: alpha/beta hydrolase [Magnetococcus sp. WYHC-3]